MNRHDPDRVADAFAALADADPAARAALLDRYENESGRDFRVLVERLVDADATRHDPVAGAVDAAMHRLVEPEREIEALGPYRLLRELGSGGMGTVFLAERADGAYTQHVAIKLLRGFPTADGMRRLRRERQILATLDHPGIARLIDGGETTHGQPYLVLEHVDGLPLAAWIKARAPSRAARLAFAERLLEAIQHAHQRLVVHRDLKPANILVRDDCTPKLLDFGIAKLIETGDARETSTRVMTPAYASPEQQAGRPITTASDLYSAGVLLHEVLLAGDAPPLDAELRGIVAKATATDPTARYASAEAFADDLARYREGRPVRAAADTRRYRLSKFIQRHRIAASLAMLALALAAAFVWQLDAERRRALAAETAAAQALADARRENARADAINGFLVSLFRLADPNVNRGEQLDARALLERGAARVDTELKDQPDLRAAMLATLADAMRGLAEYERAEPLMQASLDATTGTDRATVRLRAERLSLLASIRARRGDRTASLAASDRAIAELDAIADDDPDLRVDLENTRAMALKWLDRTDEAAAALERVLALLPRTGARETEHRAYALDNLAHVREAQGRWDEAQQTAGQARAAFAALNGERHPTTLSVGAYAASLQLMRGHPDAARDAYVAVLDGQRGLLAANDRRLTNTETSLARAWLRLGEPAKAKPLLDSALARCDASFGGDRTSCPLTVQTAGEREAAHGDAKRGIALLREAVALRDADKEPTARAQAAARHALARALCAHGQRDEGAALMRKALSELVADPRVGPGDKRGFQESAAICD
ncbi:serine/threonine-protein kinase [Tahibacter soli]|uniref:Serine/threonine-protein kinase n=1 Tax=Tahibacter soli TaxID=2983605 RepID=A0A9X4BJF1_9GAMM|nr:serine/threonine-protein kinase [Tahibacter soli]MDC8012104.1 serine/threonine-protein kinase [Tahibacter soli]